MPRNTVQSPRPAAMTPAQLRDLMTQAGIASQRELADLAGVHRVTLCRWASGVKPIPNYYAALFREILKDRLASPVA